LYVEKIFRTNLCLPPSLRPLLALPPPRSHLVAGLDQLRLLRYSVVISIGDRVTRDLVRSGVYPQIAVYDCAERREESACPELSGYREVVVRNPRSTISLEAVAALERAAKDERRTAIRVVGEEDLLALVAVIVAPLGGHVVYGLPGLSAVDIVVDPVHKRKVLTILSMFRECE